MTDTPIAHTADGRPIFDNTPTVVSVLATECQKLITVRRNNEPGRDLLGLPGGYHMRGETWQEAGCRELWEETGYVLDPDFLKLLSVETDEYGNNLIIASALSPVTFDPGYTIPEEVQDVVLLEDIEYAPKQEWAFPRHYDAASVYWGDL